MRLVTEWLRDFDTTDNDEVLAFAADNDGNIYMTGYSEDIMIAAAQLEFMGANGDMTLKKGVPHMGDQPEDLPAGLGQTTVWLLKFNSSGALVWRKELGTETAELSLKLATDRDGDVILARVSENEPATLTKFGARGNTLWSVEIQDAPSVIIDVATDSEKHILVALSNNDGPWITRYDGQSNAIHSIDDPGQITLLAVDDEDNLLIAGQGPTGVFVGKLRPSTTGADELWRRQLDVGEGEVVNAITTDTDGSVYLAGVIDNAVGGHELETSMDAWLSKYSRDGHQMWFQALTASNSEDVATTVTVDRGGYIYVAGHTTGVMVQGYSAGDQDIWLAKYLPDGSELWLSQRAITDSDSCVGLALDTQGFLYIAGVTVPQGAFPSDGWVARLREEPETPGELWSLIRANGLSL
jgi:hypothetical protein